MVIRNVYKMLVQKLEGRRLLGKPTLRRIKKRPWRKRAGGRGLDSSGPGKGLVACSCKHGMMFTVTRKMGNLMISCSCY
jgi:hypothetical protein